MGSETKPLNILFFPLMAPGHMKPMVDLAKIFARRGVKATILTTPANAPSIQQAICHHPITVLLVPFPRSDNSLPEGCENLSSVPSPEQVSEFLNVVSLLGQSFDKILTEHAPDCVVTDTFLPWTYAIAAEHGVPRLEFNGTCFFSRCAADSLERHKPLENLPHDAESLVLPGLPHRIEMLRAHFPDFTKFDPGFVEVFRQVKEVESKTYGMVVNSFYELEPDYAEYYRKVIGRKAWHIGPMFLCNKDDEEMLKEPNKEACFEWLDSKTPGSVVYVAFGSLGQFSTAQLREMALGLEACGHPFMWVVKDSNSQDWMPEGYKERIEGRGLLIRGWAPQVLILNHPAVGGFVTHCGWNSSLEGMSTGVPLVTWPCFADQFYNEKLIVDVLKVGVSVGVKEICALPEKAVVVEAAKISKAVDELMDSGEVAEGRRKRARELGEKARKAVGLEGSSYVEMGNLISELMHKCAPISVKEIEAPDLKTVATTTVATDLKTPISVKEIEASNLKTVATTTVATTTVEG